MESSLVQELFRRRAVLATLNPRNPLSNSLYAVRYNCTCDGSPPINQEDWTSIAEPVPIK
jgi:hypothetical protein